MGPRPRRGRLRVPRSAWCFATRWRSIAGLTAARQIRLAKTTPDAPNQPPVTGRHRSQRRRDAPRARGVNACEPRLQARRQLFLGPYLGRADVERPSQVVSLLLEARSDQPIFGLPGEIPNLGIRPSPNVEGIRKVVGKEGGRIGRAAVPLCKHHDEIVPDVALLPRRERLYESQSKPLLCRPSLQRQARVRVETPIIVGIGVVPPPGPDGLAGQSGKPFLRWAGSKRKIAALA